MQNYAETCLSRRYAVSFSRIVSSGDVMKRFRQFCVFSALLGALIWFLADSARLRAAAVEALSLCARSVIPALFPFLVVSSLLVHLGFASWVTPWCSGLMSSLFRLPGHAGSALILGLIAGYPVGARTAADLYRSHLLTQDEAQRLTFFCNNSNPVFLISVLGTGVFHSVRIGVWLWLIHVASALLTGLLFRGHKIPSSRRHTPPSPASVPESIPGAFVTSVRSAATTMLFVCAFVTLFYTLATPLYVSCSPLGTVLVGCLELFSLTPLLSNDSFSFLVAAGCSGWGSLSVLCQTAAVLEDSGLSLRFCALGKLCQGVLSVLLAIPVACWLFP